MVFPGLFSYVGKIRKSMTVYTHSGMFHMDDAMAVAVIQLIDPDVEVRRVREVPATLEEGDVVVDVGGKYDPIGGWFDHHQSDSPVRESDGHKYAAAGMVWLHFCDQAIEAIMGYEDPDGDIAQRVATVLVDAVDDADNGVASWSALEGKRPVSLSAGIAMLNPPVGSEEGLVDSRFRFCASVAYELLKATIHAAAAWVEMAVEVNHCLDSGAAHWIRLEKAGQWQEHVLAHPKGKELLYVIFPSDRGGWMVQAVPEQLGSFKTRKPLPETWAGARGETLKQLVSLDAHGSATFCHAGRFIAGAETFEDAVKLADRAIAS